MWPFDNISDPMKYIGSTIVTATEEHKFSGVKNKFEIRIGYYMNEGGSRSVKILHDKDDWIKWIRSNTQDWVDAVAWMNGGPFPEDFKHEEVLEEMLMRMVDQKLGLRK